MKNSKAIALLKSLSSNEVKDFGKYLVYKSTNKKSKLLDFYNYLKRCYPEFQENKVDNYKIAQKLYPNEKEAKSLKNINNLILRIRRELESFLVQIELEKSKEEKEFLYLKALKSRKFTKFFFDETDKLERDWKKNIIPGIEHMLNLYRLKKMRFTHPGFLKQSEFTIQPNLIIKQLEQFFIAEKTSWTLNGYFSNLFLNSEKCNDNEQPIPLEKLIGELERKHFAESKQIALLIKIYKAVNFDDFSNYQEIEQDFFDNYKLFNNIEINELVTFLTQICYKNHQKGCTKALNNLFRINKFAAEQKIFLQNEMIASDIFHNVVNIAFAVDELEWAKNFIDEYTSFVQESERNDAVALSKAKYHFHSNEFEKALNLLLKLSYMTLFYKLQGRLLELQVYFEMNDIQNFEQKVSAFKYFLRNNEINGDLSKEQKDSFLNFINFMVKLNEYIFMKDRKKIKRLQSAIADCSLLVNKAWLTHKVALNLKARSLF